jgi:hypothetical protein
MMSAAKGKGQGPETLITVHFRPLICCEALEPKRNQRKKTLFKTAGRSRVRSLSFSSNGVE